MQDLKDFAYFHAVVTHLGFSAAARHIGVPKGTLSKSVARLEEQLQVRLLERSTRKLRTTDVGQAVFEQCGLMMSAFEAAQGVAASAQIEPNGLVRMSCPQGLVQNLVGGMLRRFLVAYPAVRIQLLELNHPADLIENRVDLALRVRTEVQADTSSVVRKLGSSRRILTINSKLADDLGSAPMIHDLATLPTLALAHEETHWSLLGPCGDACDVQIQPRLLCSDVEVLRLAARDGLGIALLPEHVCRDDLLLGELTRLFPQWHSIEGTIYAMFSSRRGLSSALRTLIDYLVNAFNEPTPPY